MVRRKWRRTSEASILDILVDISNNQVVLAQGSSFTPVAQGHALPPPATVGTLADTSNPISSTPRVDADCRKLGIEPKMPKPAPTGSEPSFAQSPKKLREAVLRTMISAIERQRRFEAATGSDVTRGYHGC